MLSSLGPLAVAMALGVGPYGGVYGDQLYPYDQQDHWLHGYHQEIPAYGGYHAFRPYNYKHVFSQAQTAGGWGHAVNLPYSQQFWNRYHQNAAMQAHMSRVSATEYAAQLARMKAERDFDYQQKLVQQGQYPHARPQHWRGSQPNQVVASETQQHLTDLKSMQDQLSEQLRELKAVQQTTYQQQQTTSQTATPQPAYPQYGVPYQPQLQQPVYVQPSQPAQYWQQP